MAVMRHSIIFGGVNSADYGIYISGEGVFNAPKRAVEMTAIPGRNGDLARDRGRYDNISVKYPAFNYETSYEEFARKLAAFRSAICSQISYQRLEDTFHPDEYRMAVFADGLAINPIKYNSASQFELVFNCKPQRFLTSGEVPIGAYTLFPLTDHHKENITTESGGIIEVKGATKKIVNPTLFDAKPFIKVEGYGTFSIGNTVITITGSAGQIIFIDCDSMEIYKKQGGIITPASSLVSFSSTDFPSLPPGESGLTYSSTITDFNITPRWWIV